MHPLKKEYIRLKDEYFNFIEEFGEYEREWNTFQESEKLFTKKIEEYSNNMELLNRLTDREKYAELIEELHTVVKQGIKFIKKNTASILMHIELLNEYGEMCKKITATIKDFNIENLEIYNATLNEIQNKGISAIRLKIVKMKELELQLITEMNDLNKVYSASIN